MQRKTRREDRENPIYSPKAPIISRTLRQPCRSKYSSIPRATFTVTAGSMKLAVPISMAEAPAKRNSMASRAFMIPPKPTTGIFTALATCHTIRKAMGFTAAPDMPPVTVESIGRLRSASIAIPSRVLMRETLSAPPFSAARAISVMSVTFGESFTISVFFVN